MAEKDPYKVYDFSANCEKYGYLLTWEEASQKTGFKLNPEQKTDEYFYFGMLIATIMKNGFNPIMVE